MIERLRTILVFVVLIFGVINAAAIVPAALNVTPVASAEVASVASATDMQVNWYYPVEGGGISSGYGPRNDGFHGGIDIAATYDAPVIAPAAIDITYAGAMNGYGTAIEAIFINRPNWKIRVGHCTWDSVNRLSVGMQFAGGVQFAATGSEGKSTGPHVHLELYIDGTRVDPSVILAGGPGPDTIPSPAAANPTNPGQAVDPLTDLINKGKELIGVK